MFNPLKTSIKSKMILLFSLLWSTFISSQNIYDTALVDTVSINYKKEFDVKDFIKIKNISGFLIGSASLDYEVLSSIVNNF